MDTALIDKAQHIVHDPLSDFLPRVIWVAWQQAAPSLKSQRGPPLRHGLPAAWPQSSRLPPGLSASHFGSSQPPSAPGRHGECLPHRKHQAVAFSPGGSQEAATQGQSSPRGSFFIWTNAQPWGFLFHLLQVSAKVMRKQPPGLGPGWCRGRNVGLWLGGLQSLKLHE